MFGSGQSARIGCMTGATFSTAPPFSEESHALEVAQQIEGTVIMLGLTIPELAELIRDLPDTEVWTLTPGVPVQW